MKKQILLLIALVLAFSCTLVSCELLPYQDSILGKEPKIEIDEEGYLVVNHQKTEYKVYVEPVISVIDGYVAVNGKKTEYEVKTVDRITVSEDGYVVVNDIKTEHKVHVEQVLSAIDGYVAVNGVKTEYKIYKEPEISVMEGYVAVNGIKTEYKVHVDAVVSVIDGYVALNGVKTEYKVHKDPVISVIDGYIAVDGVKTEFISGDCPHIWKTETIAPTCIAGGYDITYCDLCERSTTHNETPATGHVYSTTYTSDSNYHWIKCTKCTAITQKGAHVAGEIEYCTTCLIPMSDTTGVIYDVSADGTYAEVIDYVGTATKVRIADEYAGLPVKNICNDVFANNRSIVTVILPDSVTTIGEEAFWDCSNLVNVTIPESVTTIGGNAFYSCDKLSNITIPKSVTKIGDYAFASCSSLTSITVEEGNPVYHSSGNCLIETASKTLVKGCNNSVIPTDGSVISIGQYAFRYCNSLTSVTIPDGVGIPNLHPLKNNGVF